MVSRFRRGPDFSKERLNMYFNSCKIYASNIQHPIARDETVQVCMLFKLMNDINKDNVPFAEASAFNSSLKPAVKKLFEEHLGSLDLTKEEFLRNTNEDELFGVIHTFKERFNKINEHSKLNLQDIQIGQIADQMLEDY